MNKFKITKGLLISLCFVLISGCSINNNQELENNNTEITQEVEKSKEEIVNGFLDTVFTVNKDDYELFSSGTIGEVTEKIGNQIKPFLTDTADYKLIINRMGSMTNRFITNEVTSVINEIELDFRETSSSNELVCYYQFNLTTNFEVESIEPFTDLITGAITLHEGDGWKINAFDITSPMRRYYDKIYYHINN